MAAKLPSTWETREWPALLAVAQHLDQHPGDELFLHDLAQTTGTDTEELRRATAALLAGGYIEASVMPGFGPTRLVVTGLTEKGRRASGLWPEGDTFDALIDALQEAADSTDDPDERGKLENLRRTALDTGKGVMNAVIQAWIKRMTGLD